MPAADAFSDFNANLTSPATHAAVVTADDATDLGSVTRGIAIGAAGALKVTTAAGEVVVIPSGVLAAGVIHPLRVTRVWSTGTDSGVKTAGIVAFW